MKKLVLSHLAVILLLTLITPAYSSVELRATIAQDIHVVFDFLNVTAYERIKDQIDEFTIPDVIKSNLEERNLTNVEYRGEPVHFNDAEKSISLGFYLFGSDILKFTFSRETMRRTCRVRTDWRWFELNLTEDFYLNFTEYFGRPLSKWDFENETCPTYYYLNYTGTVPFDPICYFILPKEATDVHVEDMETIVFELPPSLGESLLNSPFLILGAIMVVNIVVLLYRTIRKQRVT